MKEKKIFWLLVAFIIGILLLFHKERRDQVSYQEAIAEEIIRLHVIADSDRDCDQELKLKVKDAVVERLRGELDGAESVEEAREIIGDNLGELEVISQEVIEENGFSYKATASLGQAVFPVKQYGDLVFPAGEYEALRIFLGKAEGRNWWCVMFPTLCFVDETKQEITEENKEKFKEVLTEEEYESLCQKKGDQIFFKLKIMEYLNKVIDYFSI
ncbi:MAG: stage II sporulation protein R [Acetivibrio ethanolgignens]